MKLIAILLALATVSPTSAEIANVQACAPTPQAAIAHLLTHTTANSNSNDGFRIDSIRLDPIRHTRWADVVSCENPTRPHVSVQLPQTIQPLTKSILQPIPQPIAVHTGDPVTVLSGSDDSRMTLAGSAIESGPPGATIRVRLSVALGGPNFTTIPCTVLRAGVVEARP